MLGLPGPLSFEVEHFDQLQKTPLFPMVHLNQFHAFLEVLRGKKHLLVSRSQHLGFRVFKRDVFQHKKCLDKVIGRRLTMAAGSRPQPDVTGAKLPNSSKFTVDTVEWLWPVR